MANNWTDYWVNQKNDWDNESPEDRLRDLFGDGDDDDNWLDNPEYWDL